MSRVVGIDFGTTKTVAAIFDGRHSTVIPDRRGHQHIPSVVLVSPEQEFFIGWEARDHPARYQSESISFNSIKRVLGHRMDKSWGWLKDHPEAVAALILGRLKLELENHFGEEVNDAVIAIPAHYDINKRWAVKQAAEVAGFQVLRMLNEATAAALAYYVKKLPQDSRILVLDFGGGTLDASILELGDGVCEVKATAGDGMLGGDDFDQILMDYILEKAREQYSGLESWNPFQQTVIREAATRAKVELSSANFSQINVPGLIQISPESCRDLNLTIDRDTFYRLSQKLFDRTEAVVLRVFKDAGLECTSMDAALLIGGTSRIPAVREIVRKNLKREPVIGVDPETCVAEGAAVLASVLTGIRTDILLLDTYPNSLSTSTSGGVATCLIERNTTIPTRKNEVFSTNKDNQTQVDVQVYEGERPMAADNVLVGAITLTGIPPAPRGMPQIEVTFDIDGNGILNVSARDLTTGRSAAAVMTAPSKLPPERMEVVKGIVAMEMEKVRDHFVQEEALNWVHVIETLLTEHGNDLTEQQVSIFQGGCQVVADYIERKASADTVRNLLAGLKKEFDNALSGFDHGRSASIARNIMAIFEDGELASWAELAAAHLYDDDSILRGMRDFEAQYKSFIKTVVQNLNDASSIADVCDQVLASLQESPGAKHCFGLVLSHFAPRVPLTLEKIAEPSILESRARSLLTLLLFRELGRDKTIRRRAVAARTLSNICQPQYLVPLINRIQDEAIEMIAPLQQCLSKISSEAWYTYYNSIEPERRQGRFSLAGVRLPLRDALLEMLRVKDVDEQKAILSALTDLTDNIPVHALLDTLNRTSDDDLQCQIIALLPRCEGTGAVVRLLELSVANNQVVREAAQKALEECSHLMNTDWAESLSTREWHKYYFAMPPLIQNRWLTSALVRPKLRKALLKVLPEKTVDEQRAILGVLAQIAHADDIPDFIKLLTILTHEETCCQLISILPALHDRRVVDPLIKLLVDERKQVREAASAALEQCKDLVEPETERFIKITKAAIETGRAPSLTNRFFLSGYLKRHRELEEVASRLKEQQRT